jgi:hypothetical protein
MAAADDRGWKAASSEHDLFDDENLEYLDELFNRSHDRASILGRWDLPGIEDFNRGVHTKTYVNAPSFPMASHHDWRNGIYGASDLSFESGADINSRTELNTISSADPSFQSIPFDEILHTSPPFSESTNHSNIHANQNIDDRFGTPSFREANFGFEAGFPQQNGNASCQLQAYTQTIGENWHVSPLTTIETSIVDLSPSYPLTPHQSSVPRFIKFRDNQSMNASTPTARNCWASQAETLHSSRPLADFRRLKDTAINVPRKTR